MQRGNHRDQQQKRRKRERDVGEPHHDLVHPFAVESRHEAKCDAECECDSLRDETDGQRDARAEHEAGPDVASLNVRPEPVLRRRALKEVRQIDRNWILPGDERGQNRGESHDDDDADPDSRAVVAQEPLSLFGI